jgi:hypothetical protein
VTDFKLKRTVAVSPDPSRDDYTPGALKYLEAGTSLDEIPESELAQLSPAHFAGDDGTEPEDWRTDEATLEHDRRQAKNTAAENKARDKARATRRAEKAES